MDNKTKLTKEQKKEMRDELASVSRMLMMSMDSFMTALRKIRTWEELSKIMLGIHSVLILNDHLEMRMLYGLLTESFFKSIGAGGSSDADIVATRMSLDFENNIEPAILKSFSDMAKEIDNAEEKETDSTRKTH